MPQPENRFKTYDVDGMKMVFNADLFGDLFTLTARKNDVRFGKYEILLSEKLNVSKDTVHGWRFGKFAPGDIELVKTLATELGTDFEKLLKEKKEMSADIKKFNDMTRMKVAEVYKILSPYFEDCRENFEKYGKIERLICNTDDLILKYPPDDENLEKVNALL
ncbi:MAG: hypothetical protein LUG27_05490, partial [Clostridiales bacterium]|nr:hypothetical protein [Clostridiales bacterium]